MVNRRRQNGDEKNVMPTFYSPILMHVFSSLLYVFRVHRRYSLKNMRLVETAERSAIYSFLVKVKKEVF